jgi:hypothetical protein
MPWGSSRLPPWGRAGLVLGALAPPGGHAGPLWRIGYARHARALVGLSAPAHTHVGLGSRPAPLGLDDPPLLVTHLIGTRLAHEWFDTTDSYTRVVLALWEQRPDLGVRQALVLAIPWTHGCLGVHF